MNRSEAEEFVAKLDDLDALVLIDELIRAEKLNLYSYHDNLPLVRDSVLGSEIAYLLEGKTECLKEEIAVLEDRVWELENN